MLSNIGILLSSRWVNLLELLQTLFRQCSYRIRESLSDPGLSDDADKVATSGYTNLIRIQFLAARLLWLKTEIEQALEISERGRN